MSNELKSLGQNIAAARQSRGYSQSDLAEAIGVTQGTVSQWEHGNIDIPYSTLCRIASTLNLAPSQLSDASVSSENKSQAEERLDAVNVVAKGDKRIPRLVNAAASLTEAKLRVLMRTLETIQGTNKNGSRPGGSNTG